LYTTFADEYYDQCVQPKPNIPKCYPGVSGKKKRREAAHLQSYKDNVEDDGDDDDDDDDDDDKGDEVERDEQQHIDEFNSSIHDSNMNQIDFETNDFNHMFEETDDLMGQGEQNSSPKVTEIPAGSAQWRIQPNNVNRPLGAAPLVPNDAPRGKLRLSGGRAGCGKQKIKQQRRGYNQFGSNNNNLNNTNQNSPKNSIQSRLGFNQGRNSHREQLPMKQRIRNAYNALKNDNNNDNVNKQQQVLMNMNNHFQKSHPQIWNLSTPKTPMQQNLNYLSNLIGNQFSSNTNESKCNTFNNLIENRVSSNTNESNCKTFNNSIQHQLKSNSNEFTSNNWVSSNNLSSLINSANQIGNTNITNNALSRLGPALQNQSNDLGVCHNWTQPNVNSSLNEMRLADLMNINQNSLVIGREMAKSALLLLSSVYHKPILDEDVQQELSHLQVSCETITYNVRFLILSGS